MVQMSCAERSRLEGQDEQRSGRRTEETAGWRGMWSRNRRRRGLEHGLAMGDLKCQ